jgi:hypothetical protein
MAYLCGDRLNMAPICLTQSKINAGKGFYAKSELPRLTLVSIQISPTVKKALKIICDMRSSMFVRRLNINYPR